MSIYLKEDVKGIMTDGNVLCAECYDDDMIDLETQFIVEESLQEFYFICDECGECL